MYKNHFIFYSGNAEITDLFKCENKKTTCCSPKKALKHRQAELKKIEKIEKEAMSRNNPKVNHQSHQPRPVIHGSISLTFYEQFTCVM